MSLNRSVAGGVLTDDDGTGATGTILNNSERQSLLDVIDSRWTVQTITLTGTQNNVSITSGGVEADVLICNNASDLTLTGIAAPASPAKPGKKLLIRAIGAGHVYLAHNSGSSSSGNKFSTLATTGNTPLCGGSGSALLHYDGSAWVLDLHEQGGFIQIAFAAGNFTGSGSMTWTVASGDRFSSGYLLRGRTMYYQFAITTSTVGGTLSNALRIAIAEFGGFTPSAGSGFVYNRLAYANDNGTLVEAYCDPASTYLEILKTSGANWAAATDSTYVYGNLQFSVS